MSSNFKYIVIFIIASLLAVFVVQLFWMKGLYNSIEAETEKQVIECIKQANTYELEYRMDSIDRISDEKDSPDAEITISQSFASDKEDTKKKDKKIIKKERKVRGQDTIDTREEIENDFSLNQFESLGIRMRELIHEAIDTIVPVNLDTLHFALLNAFDEKNIKSEIYKVEIVNIDTDSIISTLQTRELESKSHISSFVYDSNNQLSYQIHMQSLTQTILEQMLGILITTLIIIIILAWAFVFLIRTVLKLKTLDEMKEDFTSNMTHELKTPIAVAYSATDVLLNFGVGEDKEKRKMYLSVCKEQLEKLTNLVEQILSMSTERRLKLVLEKENVEIKDMLTSLTEQHKIKADKDVNFVLNINPENMTIYADRTHLNNVLSNLIDNAIKYSKESVSIVITAYEQDGYSIIKVKDNGIGIASDKLKYLFDKFYRVPQGNKHNTKGYGIGLFYVQTIVNKHQGNIGVVSAVGGGTEFTIKIASK